MEAIHNLKSCPWITYEPIKIKEYFTKYQKSLDNLYGRSSQEKMWKKEGIKDFFPQWQVDENPFDIKKVSAACSVDLLCDADELEINDIPGDSNKGVKSISNWYAGTFQDGVIPSRGSETLATLRAQDHELQLRNNVRDYAKLRYNTLKYSSTVRIPTSQPTSSSDFLCQKQRDIVLNVRVQRPYHKKMHLKRSCNRFPKHSQELLVLGSQKLSVLRDHINCINDMAVNKDLSHSPEFVQLSYLTNNSMEFPSGFFYINGVIYDDMRHTDSKRYSENIIKWAKKNSEIGKIESAVMEETKFEDLELRLGYPYVYMHQGNCEHLLVFTDIRLHHQHDVQDVSQYPVLRGHALKIAQKCNICTICLANWIVKDDPRIMMPYMHVCDSCLKLFFYNQHGEKINNFKVYSFIDEFMFKQKKYHDFKGT
ncbi:hypothetical protein Pmani_032070 [Petrolisthes manimaculis]|uniref:snRNA-activating protein complex subunit 3 n=1 Tax=Petrolisthes manimaculis TaxID=1843537 RepID=A0AAE1NSG7_9EUCA|nr:hypothetical protein Pmani_032070 [Petrolisthes manimaculis]